jgi:hypothetical protein
MRKLPDIARNPAMSSAILSSCGCAPPGAPRGTPGEQVYGLKLEQYGSLTDEVGFTHYSQYDAKFTPPVIAPLNEWIHLVYVNRTGLGLELYMNGELAASDPRSIDLPRGYISQLSNSDHLSAVLDEVVLYDRALSASEIAEHYDAIPEPTSFLSLLFALVAWSDQSLRRPTCRINEGGMN